MKQKVPEKKEKALAELISLANENRTTMIVSIENISAMQFQQLKRALKEAKIKVVKKNLMIKALEQVKNKKDIKLLKKWVEKNFAVIFSDIEPFELASMLSENQFPAKAKAGQTATKDIIIESGPTELVAGPIISELSKLKIKAAIEAGKIVIKEPCTVVKQGQIINAETAVILSKLEIVPFLAGFEPLAVYDSKENKIYEKIKIDKKALIEELKKASTESLNFAVRIEYTTKETISLLLTKAVQESIIISKLMQGIN